MPYYLPITEGRTNGFMPLPRVWVQTASSMIWTRIATSISYNYAKHISITLFCIRQNYMDINNFIICDSRVKEKSRLSEKLNKYNLKKMLSGYTRIAVRFSLSSEGKQRNHLLTWRMLLRLVWFYGISTIFDDLMPNHCFYIYIYINIYIYIYMICKHFVNIFKWA